MYDLLADPYGDREWRWFREHRDHPDLVAHIPTHRITWTPRNGEPQHWEVMWVRCWDAMRPLNLWHVYDAQQWATKAFTAWAFTMAANGWPAAFHRTDGTMQSWKGELSMQRLDGTGERHVTPRRDDGYRGESWWPVAT